MSGATKSSLSPLMMLFLLAQAWLFSLAACTPQTSTTNGQINQTGDGTVSESAGTPAELVFAGQIAAEDGRWLNDFVVILFKNGEEIARTTSSLFESDFSSDGPMDGVFELHIPNVYKLSSDHKFLFADRSHVPMELVLEPSGTRYLGTWFDDVSPAGMKLIAVPAKQLEYCLVVLPLPEDELTDKYKEGNLSLQGSLLVIHNEDNQGTGSVAADASDLEMDTPPGVQFTVLPSENDSTAWNLQMTGFFGSRWEVWELFLAGRVGMSWETFKDAVLVHNPHLESDSYIFYPDKQYLLPMNE